MNPHEAQETTHRPNKIENRDFKNPADVLSLVHSLLGQPTAFGRTTVNDGQRNEILEMALKARKFCLERLAELRERKRKRESMMQDQRAAFEDYESSPENTPKRMRSPMAVDLSLSAHNDDSTDGSVSNLVIDESMQVETLVDVNVIAQEANNISNSTSASENIVAECSFSPSSNVVIEEPPLNCNAIGEDAHQEIGPNGTLVPIYEFAKIAWESPAMATRTLLPLVFSEDILATHTLSGKPSPAFRGRERPHKGQLDALKVADIIYCVMEMTNCKEREVRNTITTKCADATKKYRRLNIHVSLDKSNSN